MHYQSKEWQVYCKSLFHGRISVLSLWRVHRMYPCVCYPSKRVIENKFGSFRKTKNSAFNNWSKILRPNLSKKFSGDDFEEKKPIKTLITYNNICICQITVYLENFRLWNQIWPKETIIKILRNTHWIHNQHNISNSCVSHCIIYQTLVRLT